jgi:phosphopantetheine--protein transferase-like protein
MEDKIKSIISTFIKIPAEQITVNTAIDRTALNSSIALHRMYAKLAEEGYIVSDYWSINTFSTLLQRINGNVNASLSEVEYVPINRNGQLLQASAENVAVGIDIEEIDAMPRATDFRENEFYKMNFSSAEIAYCILQPAPYASFAGLFAAKEAIVKANNSNRSKPFNTIVISHDQEGKPTYPGLHVSISHTNNLALAVALQMVADQSTRRKNEPVVLQQPDKSNVKWLFVLSFIISLVALFIALYK